MLELNKISPQWQQGEREDKCASVTTFTSGQAQISILDCVLYGVGAGSAVVAGSGWQWLVVTIPTKET